jgi:1,2-diacylglycerol 3-beta-glucosyltransferase
MGVTSGWSCRRPVRTALWLSGSAVALASGYLATLSVAAVSGAGLAAAGAGGSATTTNRRLVVLVPAHNEEALLGRCLTSLSAQDYPRDLVRVVVIADNCTDHTARLAAATGAGVLERTEPTARGKGYALRWAMDAVLRQPEPPDAFVVVDADSVVDPGLLRELAGALGSGARVAQADYEVLLEEPGHRAQLRAAAFLLFHRVRFGGRAALGLPCNLVGNGMLLARDVVELHPWDAFTGAEDLEYSIDLRLDGLRPVFAAAARVWGPVSSSGRGARTQRMRWEGGRAHVVKTRLPMLLRAVVVQRRWSLWDAAVDLAIPPLGIVAVATVAGTALTALLIAVRALPRRALTPWAAAAAALAVHVLIGLRAAGAPPSTYAALRAAPGLVINETLTRLRLVRGSGADGWERTVRPGE